jgi:hypothetical protein
MVLAFPINIFFSLEKNGTISIEYGKFRFVNYMIG